MEDEKTYQIRVLKERVDDLMEQRDKEQERVNQYWKDWRETEAALNRAISENNALRLEIFELRAELRRASLESPLEP